MYSLYSKEKEVDERLFYTNDTDGEAERKEDIEKELTGRKIQDEDSRQDSVDIEESSHSGLSNPAEPTTFDEEHAISRAMELSMEQQPRPGAQAIAGIDGSVDEGTIQYGTDDSVVAGAAAITAHAVDTEEENRRRQEHMRIVEERNQLRNIVDNAVVADVVDGGMDTVEKRSTGDGQGDASPAGIPGRLGCGSRKGRLIWTVSALLVSSAVLGIALYFILKPDPTPSSTTLPTTTMMTTTTTRIATTTMPPSTTTPMPTPTFTSTKATTASTTTSTTTPTPTVPQDLIDLLSSRSFDGGSALQTPSTPQNKALNWLARNTNLTNYKEEKKVQRYALASFFYSSGGANWRTNTTWLDDGDECDRWWANGLPGEPHRLTCVNGSVDKLLLSGNSLVGTIPPELGLLSDPLEYLSLGHNSLTGTIPTELFLLTQLSSLALMYNNLAGTIPTEIGQLTNIRQVIAEENNLFGSIPSEIYSLTNLAVLQLNGGQWWGNFTCPDQVNICWVSCGSSSGLGSACRDLVAAPLDMVTASFPEVNCVFFSNCTVIVSDCGEDFSLPGTTLTGRLVSRRSAERGEVGTPGAGLYEYSYRFSLEDTAVSPEPPSTVCVKEFIVDFGSFTRLDYNSDGIADDLFVGIKGTLGEVQPSSVVKTGNKIQFIYSTPICAWKTSFPVGLATDAEPTQDAAAHFVMTNGKIVAVDACGPTIN